MKQIKAFIRHNMIDGVIDALETLEYQPGLTLSNVRGYGHPEEATPYKLIERVKLETVVPDDQVNIILKTILDNARTGRKGDGKIFISPVETAVRIRTGEEDSDALQFRE